MKKIGIILLSLISLTGLSVGMDILTGYDFDYSLINLIKPFKIMELSELLFLMFLVLICIIQLSRRLIQKWLHKDQFNQNGK